MRETLTQVLGVKTVNVNFDRKEAEVTYDDQKVKAEEIVEQLDKRTQGRYTAEVKK